MYYFGKASKRKLEDAHEDVKAIMQEAIETAPFDFTILDVFRDKKRQAEAYAQKNSTKQWPDSIHNVKPVMAVDVARYYPSSPHVRWRNLIDFKVLYDHIAEIAEKHGYNTTWGADWDGDDDIYEHQLIDMPHIQFKKKSKKKVVKNG